MAHVAVVPKTIKYPDADGLPMAENESQFWPILYVGSALDRYYQDREDVYVVGNLLLYYQKAPPGEPASAAKSVSPDLMVVLGASKRVRSSYVLWQESKAPDFVLEIASESTYRIDQSEKRATYAGMGVMEYWQYDPVGSYLAPPLLGNRLVDGGYRPIPAKVQSGGLLSLRSEVLGLELHLTPGAPVREALHFYDPVRGEYLRTYREEAQAREEEARARQEADQAREEEAQARRQAEGRLEQTEGQLRQTQDRLREEQAARQVLEDELRELRRRE